MYHYLIPIILAGYVGIASASAAPVAPGVAASEDQTLVSVGDRDITAAELRKVVSSSPIATQFNTMDEPDQAMVRGRMLKNLIYSEMLYQQALAQGIDKRPAVVDEVNEFYDNLLYKQFLQSLRVGMSNPEEQQLEQRLDDDPDSLAAAQAAAMAVHFGEVKTRELLRLGKQQHLQTFGQPLQPGSRDADALVAKGDSLSIKLGELVYFGEDLNKLDLVELRRRLDNRVSQRLMTEAARQQGFDVSAQVNNFQRDLIRATLIKEKEAAWIPNREVLRDYYQQHPELSRVVPQWHVGQLVVADREQAEALRQQIIAGESLFKLAAEHSIDPYGRQNAGEMGWVRPDQAPKAIRDVVNDLPDGTVSPVIETPLGYHLVIVQERKPGSQKPLAAVAGGIRRSLILEKLAEDYQQLSEQYPITWHLSEHQAAGSVSSQN